MIKLLGYTPDIDPIIPGAITNCDALVPSFNGMKGAPSAVSTGIDALASECRGVVYLRQLDNTVYLFAGTATALYKNTGTTWTDYTRLAGGAYAVPATGRWRFAQYGSVSLAVNKSDKLQFLNGAANFALVTKGAKDAPKASIVEVVGQFVFLFDYNDGTDYVDGWYCSASGDYTDWTTSSATQCTSGRLISTTGTIRAAKRFGTQIVVYKDSGMYVGSYTGGAAVWTFELIPGTTGALSQEAVANVGTVEDPQHVFMGIDDFYMFDGTRPKPIGTGLIKQQVWSEINLSATYLCQTSYDSTNSRVYFYYPSGSSTVCDKCVVYNTRTKTWGRDNNTVEAALEYLPAGGIYSELGATYTTYANFSSAGTYAQISTVASQSYPAIFKTDHKLYKLTGASSTSFLTTGDMGNESQFGLLQRVRPQFLKAPTSATMTNYYRNNLGETLSLDKEVSYSNGKFDVLRAARWHRVKFTFTGDVEIASFTPHTQQQGLE
jgi:hypothetical protein